MKSYNITLKQLKEDVENFYRLEKQNENGWDWYYACALPNLLLSEQTTLEYVNQMTKQELDVTFSLSFEIVKEFKSKQIAQAFLNKYQQIYANQKDEQGFCFEEVLLLKDYLGL